ncbi:transglutaminase, partial [Mesorhizobium sp. M7A.F.Ca.US.014.04.1.1]
MISSSMARRLRVYVAAGLAMTAGWVAPALAGGAMATLGLTSQ